MITAESGHDLKFNSSSRYRICVKGFLDDSWAERFSGMHISNETSGQIAPLTTLVGTLKDQTELVGVLNSLYEMHLPFVSVELLDDDEMKAEA